MKRIDVLDLCRSLCLFVMVVWHTCYDLALFEKLDMALMESLPARVIAWLCAGGFILISGICARFSRSNLYRGFFIFCAGAVLSLVMAAMKMQVAFGILQFFGVAMISYHFLRASTDKWSGGWFPAVCAAAFVLTWLMTENVTVGIKWLYPLGLKYEGFYSADYYPLLPWIFLFFFGSWLGGRILVSREKPIWDLRVHPVLVFPGKHSLVIYLLHQPVIFGILTLIFR